MAFINILGLALFVGTLKKICVVIGKYNRTIRPAVPDNLKGVYDGAVSQLMGACEIILAIPFGDTEEGTNPPWGS